MYFLASDLSSLLIKVEILKPLGRSLSDYRTIETISEVIVICKLNQLNPATSAPAERTFSMARRVKTWLRANINQNRFTHLALLNSHNTRTDKIRLIDVANKFDSVNESRKRNFTTFTEADLI